MNPCTVKHIGYCIYLMCRNSHDTVPKLSTGPVNGYSVSPMLTSNELKPSPKTATSILYMRSDQISIL